MSKPLRRLGGYAVAGLLLVGAGVGASWPFLEADGRRGVAAAAAVAWPVQVVAFGLLLRYRERMERFLLVWGAGTLVRMALVLFAGWMVATTTILPPAPTLTALAAFFFALLLLEPAFFGPGGTRDHGTRGT